MASHQRHSRNGGNSNWQHESRDERGRFESGNWGSSDADGQHDEEYGRFRSMRGPRDYDRDRDDGYDRGGLDMNMHDRERGDYEADYGFPQSDRGSRWNETGQAREYRGDSGSRGGRGRDWYGGGRDEMWRGRDGGYSSNERGWSGNYGEETYGPRGRYGDDRSGQGGYPMGSSAERASGRGDWGYRGGARGRDSGLAAGGREMMGSRGGYDADNYRGGAAGSRWSSQGDASQEFESRHSPGEHAGKGPKGYQRSDERIEEDVNEALSRDGSLDASEIEVSVKDGEVTLSGTVPDRRMKRRAEDCAEDCSGVRQVQNNLRLEKSASHESSSGSDSARHGKSGGKHSGNGASSGTGANSTSGSTSKHQSSSASQ